MAGKEFHGGASLFSELQPAMLGGAASPAIADAVKCNRFATNASMSKGAGDLA
jgi:hypothetical protein